MKTQKIIYLLLLIALITFTGCVPGDDKHTAEEPAGFFWGIWHGWMAPISLIWGFFNVDIHIYEPQNTGWWYDFGFYIAIISEFEIALGLRWSKRKKTVVVQENNNIE